MKKRILSVILAICMVAAMVPVMSTTASAADTCTCLTRCTDSYTDADCPVCSAAISGCLGRNLWGEIKDADGLQNAMNLSATYSTVYFELVADLALTNAITVPENANALIDLNGHTLSGDQEHGIFEVYGKLTVVDTQGTGKMTDAGGAFRICGGYVLMTGGTIENCTTFGGVYIKQGGTFKMTGGTLKNNTSYAGVLWYGEKYPASIYSSTSKDGTVIIDGAAQVLCCDQADCDHFGSICIYSNQTTLRVDGGTIKGGIYTEGTSIITSSRTGTGEGTAIQGKVENGGTISGGTYGDEVKNEAAGTISGGSFAGKVTNTGSISGGTFHSEVDNQGTISGGTYSENSVVKNTGTITGGTFLGTVEPENGTIEDSAKVSVRFVNETGETLKTLRVLRGQRITSADLPEIDPTQYGYAKVKYTVGGKEYRDNSEFTDAVRYTEDETLVAVTLISPIAYTITYNLNDGFVSSSNPFESNPTEYFSTSDDITLTNPTKEGYTFTGWGGTGLEGTNNMTVTIPKGSTGNREYTAYYLKSPSGDLTPSLYSYTVVYDTQGGSPVEPKTVPKLMASEVEVLDGVSTTRAGYMFSGWYCGSKRIALQGTTVEDLADRTDNGVITITAHWREKIEVSFNTAAQEYTYDGAEQAFEIRDTTLDGFQVTYRQNGNTVAAPTDAGSYDVIVTREEDETYKAVDVTIPDGLVIQPQEITVTIGDISDQTYTGKAIEPAITASDGTDEIPASEYTVAYTDNRNAGTATVTVTAKAGGNYTFTQATQTFTIQKKSITPTVAMAAYVYGTDPGYPEVSGNEGSGAVSVYYSTYNDIGTDTAHRQLWDVAAINGTTLNAGTYYMMAEVAESQNYTVGISPVITFKVAPDKYAAPAAPTLEGSTVTIDEADRNKTLEYALNGGDWTDVPALNNGSFVPAGLAENTGFTLSLRQKASADGNYAASDAVGCFSVAYNANGGTGIVSCAYANSGSAVTAASGFGLQRTGYTFAGWNTEADGTGTAYAVGSSITTGATLYAQWTEEAVPPAETTYTVYFDANGGSVTSASAETGTNGKLSSLPTPTREGNYGFYGWYTAANGGEKVDVNRTYTEDTILYAHWITYFPPLPGGETYAITFHANGGTGTMTAEITTGDYTLPTCTFTAPEGKQFKGWATSADGTVISGTTITVTENTTLYAIWEEVSTPSATEYTVTFDGNGGTPSVSSMTTTDQKLASLPTATRSGYAFNGWYKAADGGEQVTTATEFEQDTILYAHWMVKSSSGSSSSTTTTEKNPDGSTTTTVTDKTTGTVTETTRNTDGSTTVVETKKDGAITETNKSADGTSGTVVTDKNGEVTEVKASISSAAVTEAAKTGKAVTLPVEVPAASSTKDAPTVDVTVPKSAGSVKVEIPVENVTPGTVAVIVKADGTEEIVSTSVPTENGVVLTLDGNATVKIVDNAKAFVDIHPVNHWAEDAVDFASARGITGGTSDTTFSPNASCTRAQIVTFLWRAAGSPEPESLSSLSDVPTDAYYAKAVAWALENGITTGTGDGTTFSPDATCTRAQAMAFIYRSVQAQGGGMQGEWMFLNPFSDVDLENYYGEAVMWAVANGITNGTGDTTFSPGADCTRAQIVTFLYRFFVK